MPANDHRVSVVMITYNRSAEAIRSLEVLSQLPERPEMIVVDNGSVDSTAAAIRERFPQVTMIEAGANLGAAGRNLGIQAATTPYVALCDDDVWWEGGSLAQAADLFDEHDRLAVITGHVLVGAEETDDPACWEMQHSPLLMGGTLPGRPLLGFLAGASVIRRSAFLECGGFDPRLFLGGEEQWVAVELAVRGWHLRYVPELKVHHHPSSVRDARQRRWFEIRNNLWFAWRRRPALSALRKTVSLMRSADARTSWRGLSTAIAGLPWAMAERAVVPPEIEFGLRQLEALECQRFASPTVAAARDHDQVAEQEEGEPSCVLG
jgi:GT2 family glycosyltransferase